MTNARRRVARADDGAWRREPSPRDMTRGSENPDQAIYEIWLSTAMTNFPQAVAHRAAANS